MTKFTHSRLCSSPKAELWRFGKLLFTVVRVRTSVNGREVINLSRPKTRVRGRIKRVGKMSQFGNMLTTG